MALSFDISPIRAVTFDCYGTLIDWESGILAALRSVFGAEAIDRDPQRVIRLYAVHEREVEADAYRSYRGVLAEVAARLANDPHRPLDEKRRHALADSIAQWPAFAETPRALRTLRSRFRIGIVSNIDDDLFEGTRPRLGVDPDVLVTASQVRSYKPGLAHFKEALRRLDMRAPEVLHVAESRFHDVAPARAVGMRTVWVDRHRSGEASASGEPGANSEPDLTVHDLDSLVAMLLPA